MESNSAGEGGELRRSAAEQASEKLTITASQISSNLGTVFSRASSDAASLVGLWAFSATDFTAQHFLFLPNGRLLMVDPQGDTEAGTCSAQRMGPPGGEYASYSWTQATGALTVTGRAAFFATPGATTLTATSSSRVTDHIVRVGLNYKIF